MTRKHYKAIAEMIRRRFGTSYRSWQDGDWITRQFIQDLEDYFAADNPNFNRNQFREACGLPTR